MSKHTFIQAGSQINRLGFHLDRKALLLINAVMLSGALFRASAATVFPVTAAGSGSQAGQFAAFGGSNYLFSIQGDGTTDNTNITAQLVATNGSLTGSRISIGRNGGIPYVGFAGTNYVLVWSDSALAGSGGNDQVYGQFISRSGGLVGSPFTFGPTSEEQDMRGGGGNLLASDGNNFLVVWDTGPFQDAPYGDVHAALFNQIGGLVEPIIAITDDGDFSPELTPAVAFGRTNYLVAWNDEGSSYIDGAFVSTNGVAGTPFVISETQTPSYNPLCVAFDGTNFLVVWNDDVGPDNPNPVWNLYGRLVSPDGTFPGNEVSMVTDTNQPVYPSAAFGGGSYLLEWNEGIENGESQIFLQYFQPTPSLNSVGPEFNVFLADGTNSPLIGSVLFDGDQFVAEGILGGVEGVNSEGVELTSSTATWGAFLGVAPISVFTPADDFTYVTNDDLISITGYIATNEIVIIPDTINGYPVASISTYAFAYNQNLASVIISTNVTCIGDSAFYACFGLTNVVIPDGVTSIGGDAFGNCGLTSVFIPESVTNLGLPFIGCPLTAITVDPLNLYYSSVAGVLFSKDQTALLEYPGGQAGAYTIPGGVTMIGDVAFYYCFSVTSVTIPDTVLSIGENAFFGCTSLSGVNIPASVTNIAGAVFSGCPLTTIPVDGLNPDYSSAAGVLFNKPQTELIEYPGTKAGSYTIPGSVTSLGDIAFYYCTSLTGITIPDSVVSVGDEEFGECTSLTNISMSGNIKIIGESEFQYCSRLASITIPNGITSVGNYAFFGCSSLTKAIMPDSVKSIGVDAFADTALANIIVPANVVSVGDYAFSDCRELTAVYFVGNAPSVNGEAGSTDTTIFSGESGTAYYLPGTTLWGGSFGGWPTALWYQSNPVILNSANGNAGIGVHNNQFRFTVSWATNQSIVVQAATNLANPSWIPIATNTLLGGTNYFTDPKWTNYPNRCYRIAYP